MLKRLLVALTSLALGLGVLFAVAPASSAAAPVEARPGMKWTPDVNAIPLFDWCTLNAIGTDSGGRLVALTAGHCTANFAEGSPIWFNDREDVGPVGYISTRNLDPAFDYAVLVLDKAKVTGKNTTKNGQQILKVGPEAQFLQMAVKDGATTGVSYTIVKSNQNGVIRTQNHSAGPGDSGAPLIRTSDKAAVGILRGLVNTDFSGDIEYRSVPKALADINSKGAVPGAGFTLVAP